MIQGTFGERGQLFFEIELITVISIALRKIVAFLNAEGRRGKRRGTQSFFEFNSLGICAMLYLASW